MLIRRCVTPSACCCCSMLWVRSRLWMLMPGISLWRVLIQLTGVSLLVSYCVTLTLRAYHSTSCRATFGCAEETDPMLASLREWQVSLS